MKQDLVRRLVFSQRNPGVKYLATFHDYRRKRWALLFVRRGFRRDGKSVNERRRARYGNG
jgi:hypothetical protein